MITYQIDNLTQCFNEVAKLLEAHWEEIAGYKDKVPLDPDWDKYREMDRQGMVTFATVRDDGVMVGYSLFLVIPLIHYKQTIVAANDIIYLKPEYRKGFCGIRLLKFCHEHLTKRKIRRITWHVKPGHDWTKILIRMGYKIEEYTVGICI